MYSSVTRSEVIPYSKSCISRPSVDSKLFPDISNTGSPREENAPDFALLLNRVPRSRRRPWFQSDIYHPALLVGINASNHERTGYKTNPIHDLAMAIQFHLDAHLNNWRRIELGSQRYSDDDGRNEQYIPPPPSPMKRDLCSPWMVLFGILYESGRDGHLTIVAHIPYAPVGQRLLELNDQTTCYVSCIVDRIPLPGIMNTPDVDPFTDSTLESPLLSNFRAAICLFTLKRHALVMADAWEKTLRPRKIGRQKKSIEDEHLGSSLNADESSGKESDESELSQRSKEGNKKSSTQDNESDYSWDYEDDEDPNYRSEELRAEMRKSIRYVGSWLGLTPEEVEVHRLNTVDLVIEGEVSSDSVEGM